MIKIPFSDNFTANMDRTNSHGDNPCVVCGCQCSNPKWKVRVDHGLTHLLTEKEFEEDEGGFGLWPIGKNCLEKHPELREYVILVTKG